MLCATFLLWSGCLWAQTTLKVSGTVVSKSDNLPIIGATVVETDKTTNGAATDIDGNFYLTVPEGSTITVSYIGYKSVTMPAQSSMQVILEENNELLDEVVVTGYTTQRKADLTGSVAVVNTEDFSRPRPDAGVARQGTRHDHHGNRFSKRSRHSAHSRYRFIQFFTRPIIYR